MPTNYPVQLLFVSLSVLSTLLQIISRKPPEYALINQSETQHAPVVKLLDYEKRSFINNFTRQTHFKLLRRSLSDRAEVAGPLHTSEDIVKMGGQDYTLIDQSKNEKSPVVKLLDHGKRTFINTFTRQTHFKLLRRSLSDRVEVAGPLHRSEDIVKMEGQDYALIDQSKQEKSPVVKLLDREKRSFINTFTRQTHFRLLSRGLSDRAGVEGSLIDQSRQENVSAVQFLDQEKRSLVSTLPRQQHSRLLRRNLGDMSKLLGVSSNAKDGGKRARQGHKIENAEQQWRHRETGCSVEDETCVEITNEGTYIRSR
ncbi:hypothetical protein Pst134EA_032404 [Puccinia striiformis f. sp. tritici]|uniref:uncharacterized protein n=1 Tax=Puccinia striiformis f. sp. tritici TaxID=168172 RepID=UPI002008D220|nr:uncharacterized protein Pst134EA_032404 [Puccinia striiformis f. sp. tritici]KAH9444285.1 hypothetical protein Pst134EA_032404 [Puccinia striiformis f. sp. tritici]KAH9466668.1 hypothetical protein Pst134EB_001716 [Puccinia striiformis f. sp. tritici]KAI9602070.1 hypothetical protein KEM48_001021 [Puccinia striiformis f. sp. tritici PST-130]